MEKPARTIGFVHSIQTIETIDIFKKSRREDNHKEAV